MLYKYKTITSLDLITTDVFDNVVENVVNRVNGADDVKYGLVESDDVEALGVTGVVKVYDMCVDETDSVLYPGDGSSSKHSYLWQEK